MTWLERQMMLVELALYELGLPGWALYVAVGFGVGFGAGALVAGLWTRHRARRRWYGALLPVLLMLAAVGAASPASAQASADCVSVDAVIGQVKRGLPDAHIQIVAGEPAARLRAGIVTLIQTGVPEGGSYLVVRAPGATVAYVVRFRDGCATHHGRFPDSLVRAWIDGSPA